MREARVGVRMAVDVIGLRCSGEGSKGRCKDGSRCNRVKV